MNLYKREGRRFVKTTICDNAGKYYQKDGSFVEKCTKDSIGLCIMSTTKEHVVMSLKTFYRGNFEYINTKLKNEFNGNAELPKLHELITALILFRKQLNVYYYEDIWAINQVASATHAANADCASITYYGTTSGARFIAGLRSIVRIPQR